MQHPPSADHLPNDLGRRRPNERSRRPSPWLESLGSRLLKALAPKVHRPPFRDPPSALGPWRREVLHTTEDSRLNLTIFDVEGEAQGVVVLAHPWVPGGQSYFLRRSRLKALRSQGLHAVTFDFPGFGDSKRAKPGFPDRDLSAVLDRAKQIWPGLPLYFWGVSAGGYWGHMALSRRRDVRGAMFEETPIHLIDWSDRTSPKNRPFHSFYRHGLRGAYRFLDLRRHAAKLDKFRVSYVSGLEDPGITPAETQQLADLAGGECRLVPRAAHLDTIKRDSRGVIELALQTFA